MSSDLQSPNSKSTGDVQAELKKLGKYRILRRIGAGGMGTVYLAEDTLLKRTVALKVLPKDRAENPILVRRFQSEARASAQLTHKNIVGVFDAGQADGYLYIALEYIDGCDLHEWLKKRETIPIKRSILILKQMAEALQHAHEKKLVHRDIKPANIMIAKDGTAKLADLGLARSIDETLDTTITRAGTTVGTVDYMSPEQAAHSKHADIRSDIYSLGCTWYHMLTGSPPYPNGDLTNKLRAHSENPIPDPRETNGRVTETIVAIMHRMMAKKKQDRYQRPQDLLDDLNNSSNLDANSSELLATLFAEDESSDEIEVVESESSVDFEVQEEAQSKLLKKSEPDKSPSTTPSLPQKRQRQKSKKKKKRQSSPEAQKQDEQTEENQHVDQPASRKTLKRARSAEELNRPEFATKIPQQPTQPVQKPGNKSVHDTKQTKKKTSPSKVKKSAAAQPTQKSKPGKSSPQKPMPQRTQSQKQSSLPSVELNSNSGIDVDWAKTGLFVLIAALAIGLIWWGISQFPVDAITPNVNPYGENLGRNADVGVNSADESQTKQSLFNENDSKKNEKTNSSNHTRLTSQSDEQIAPPKWIVRGWDRPTLKQQDQLKVQRGKKRRGTFLNLEDSLSAVQARPTVIDLSAVESLEIHSTDLKLKDRLTIRATRSKPVLTFHLNGFEKKSGSHSWLDVTGGTLELIGLHFVISNSTGNELEFLKLNGTDLILRDCTFTTIDPSPVTCVDVSRSSANGNRVHIENCLMRGENFSVIDAENVPCDIYCKNSIFTSQENNLIRVSLDETKVQQSVHITSCTLLGGHASLQISKTGNRASQSGCNLTLNRSLLMGRSSMSTTAIQVLQSSPDIAGGLAAKKQNINLKMRHSRFVNMEKLTVVGSTNKTLHSVSNPTQWSEFWGVILPSDDLVHLDGVEAVLTQPSQIRANDISRLLGNLAHPGVGERSSLGADPAQVATLGAEAINRELALNKIRQRELSQKPILWSGKTVRFDLNLGTGLANFLASDKCPNGTTVICFGAGIRKIPAIVLKNRKLRLRFEQSQGNPLRVEPANSQLATAMFIIDGGEFAIESGRFEIRNSNAGTDAAIFLESKNGATINLNQVRISQPLDVSTEASLIAIKSGKQPGLVSISKSMMSGFGPLINWDATNQSMTLKNVIFVSGSDSLSITANKTPGILSLNQCTFSQNKAAFHCNSANATITTFVKNCLFAPPPNSSQQASIIRGDSTDEIHKTVDWWESSCGYNSKIRTGVSVPEGKTIGSFKTAWQTFWGGHRVLDLLDGTREVVMSREIKDIDHLEFKDFTVSGSCQAAVWTDDGKPIGARSSIIGPQLIDDKPVPTKRPARTNTPVGF